MEDVVQALNSRASGRGRAVSTSQPSLVAARVATDGANSLADVERASRRRLVYDVGAPRPAPSPPRPVRAAGVGQALPSWGHPGRRPKDSQTSDWP